MALLPTLVGKGITIPAGPWSPSSSSPRTRSFSGGTMRNVSLFGRCCAFTVMGAAALLSQPVKAASAQASEATFSASDHRFTGPDTLPAGQTTIHLRNRGKEPHQLQFLKLDAGKTPAD